MKRLSAFAFLLVCCLPFVALGRDVRLVRYPHYHQGKIVFTYLGDIWIADETGQNVRRLTVHQARDIYPRFSPDGNWIAFSSNRDGNYDVYVMPASGGKPRQLTFHSANDNVVGWSTDGRRIVFESSRGQGVFPSVSTLWEVSAEGGMEQPLKTDWGSSGSYAPDGAKLAFTRHPGGWSRKHYRGSYAADLWVMDVAANKFTKLGGEDYKGNYLWPMYGRNGEIYFVSNELPNEKNIKFGGPEVMKSVNNIWKISEKGGKAVQITHHTDGNLFFPSISYDGKTIVYEDNFGLWKLDTASGKSTEIRLDIQSDVKDNDVELVTLNNDLEAFHLSPSNRRAAVAVHSEIFTIATDRGEPQRVTETPWKEQSPRWSPNGKWVAFVSDRTGREEVWISDELGKNLKKLSDADCDKSALVWSNDSKSLLWSGSDHKLRSVDIETGKEEVLASSEAGNIQGPQFSPDGKWLAYAKQDKLLRPHVWVKELATGQERLIEAPDLFLQSSGAKWTPDGKKLLLLGGVGAASIASTTGRGTAQLYSVALTPLEKDPTDRDINTEAQAEAAPQDAPGGARGTRGGAGTPPSVQVKIEWAGIERRITQLTRMPGSVSTVVPAPDSRTYLFMAQGAGAPGDAAAGGPGMYTIAEDGSRLTRLNTTVAEAGGGGGRGGGGGFGGFAEPQWARDGRSIYFMQGRGLYTLAIAPPTEGAAVPTAGGGGGRGGGGGGGFGAGAPTTTAAAGLAPRRINFTVRMEIDLTAERKQVFNEAWRVMKNRFYDAKMHGVDWAAAKNVYEPLLEHLADTEELQNLIMEMIGDLNASHTGISGGTRLPTQTPEERIQTRYPGFDLEADAAGYYKVSYIYKNGPADRDFVKLAAGNYILAVNEKPLKAGDNYWKLFNILPGRKFEFLVNTKPSLEGAWTVSLEPLNAAAHGNLLYERWVAERKQMVAKLTNNEIGYLHIRAMDAPSLAKFQRDLLENQDKQALIIDQRFNGGGGIDQELLQILGQRKVYQVTRGRDSLDVRRPAQAFFGPMVVMQNERSASDAEMFPDGFRALGLGKLVGMPTYGAVIGTGSYTLLDGSALRTPGAGVFTARGENMENYGVVPDVLIDNGPADFLTGHDRQIEKAIEVLRGQLAQESKPARAGGQR
ncbi:MAG: PD40 domain-containing protein [Acidobacteria bacterium]|nr:PD40 domain-containing protein [Acidobacteriota bacterium]MBI3421964.1 PD40 domain-containing protein [Acidobacteriota bacterium]